MGVLDNTQRWKCPWCDFLSSPFSDNRYRRVQSMKSHFTKHKKVMLRQEIDALYPEHSMDKIVKAKNDKTGN